MLVHLTIRDFVLIEELQLDLRSGFTVLTGETGAGKSMLVDALGLVLGGRAQVSMVRSGVDEAVVEALFLLSPGSPVPARLAQLGLAAGGDGELEGDGEGADEAGAAGPGGSTAAARPSAAPGAGTPAAPDAVAAAVELVIRRVIGRNGRHRAFVNGSPVTSAMLREIAADLADISSQHEHQSLLRAGAAREALDAFAGLAEPLRQVGTAWRALRSCAGELEALRRAAQERDSRLDYLRFQLDEIDHLAPRPGEDHTLRAERERLRHAGRLVEGSARALAALYEDDDSVEGRLGQVIGLLEPLAGIDDGLTPALDCLAEAQIAVQEAAARLRDYAGGLELDPRRAEEVEERLYKLEHLLRKHGPTLEQLLARQQEMAAEVARLGNAEERLADLEGQVRLASETLALHARQLGQARRAAAAGFAERVCAELAMLGMPLAVFSLELQPLPEVGEQGGEQVEMLFGPNPGEESRPLRRIASGGELSRVMLAIKRVVSAGDPVPTYLYDEVDTGVSGPVAEAIGRLLRDAARGHQILCITHHPQLAACGDWHLRVSKLVRTDGRTVSRLETLAGEARVEELARMLGGAVITPATRQHAVELLAQA